MLYKLFLCTLFTFVLGKPDKQDIYQIPSEISLNAQKNFALPCTEEAKADPDVLKKVVDRTLTNDESSKNFLFCFATKGNFGDDQGHFNIPRMSALIGNHPKVKLFEETLAECNKVTKENPVETAFAMYYCFNDNSPVLFAL